MSFAEFISCMEFVIGGQTAVVQERNRAAWKQWATHLQSLLMGAPYGDAYAWLIAKTGLQASTPATELTAAGSGESTIILTWTPSVDATTEDVWRSKEQPNKSDLVASGAVFPDDYEQIATGILVATGTYSDTEAVRGNRKVYRVVPVGAGGEPGFPSAAFGIGVDA